MPAYDYRCTACGEIFEVTRRMGDAATDETCPKCSGPATRVFGAPGVAFKGSGFHNTDYRAKPSEGSACSPKGDGCAGCPAAS